ncbi:unnamed protein product [Schistosoma rodhaini]|uniref:Uncharacterized protein n=1 Tax=Schistosoma rodhaini TaxID=6188 RepID=A0AA85FBS4_9TREM|nr:unnamed protein product [Schistosoma rodhaini]
MSLTFNLDGHVPEPSVSVEELNEELTRMRKIVRTAKVYAFRDLMRSVKKLREQMSRLGGCRRLESKMENRISDMKLLQNLSVVRLCKRLLADERDKKHLQKYGRYLTQEDRLIIRLKSSKPVSAFIKSFREKHDDWISLVHYLFYKNVSGKWKSREQKRRNRNVRGSLPLPPAPVKETELGISEDQSNNPSSYRIQNICSESENCIKTLPAQHTLSGSSILSDTNSDMSEIIARLLERKGIKKIEYFNTMYKHDCMKNGLMEQTVNKPKKVKLPLKSPDIKNQTSFNSCHENPVETHQMEDSLIDDDPLGNDDKDVRKLYKKGFVRQKYPSKVNSHKSHTKQNFPKFPYKIKQDNLQMHKTTTANPTETVITELSKPGLHPSWQAKRLEKVKVMELCKDSTTEVKHIVFDG